MPRLVRKIAIALGALFLLMIAASFVVSTLFEDEIKEKVTTAINAQLRAPFSSSNMELDIFRHFPNASIHLEQVLIKEALPNKVFPDTLLFAEDLFMEFSLFNMLGGDVAVSAISASDVVLRPGMDIDGTANYEVWVTDSTENDNTIDLKKIVLQDLELVYHDILGKVDLSAHSDKLTLAGLFNSEGNTFDIEGEVLFDSLRIRGNTYVKALPTDLDLVLLLPEAPNEYLRIQNGSLVANGVALNTDVFWNIQQGDEHIAVRLQATDVDLEGAASLIPEMGPFLIDHYGIKGRSDIDLLYAGKLDKGSGPSLDLQLKVQEGRMKERNTGVAFENILFEGGFTLNGHGRMSSLQVDKLQAQAGKGRLSGNLSLQGSKKAQLEGSIQSNVDLGDLFHFAQYEEEVEGKLDLKSNFKGSLNLSDGFSVEDLRKLEITGNAKLENASFQLDGMDHGFENMNATLVLQGKDATVKNMRATLINDPIRMEGQLKGLLSFLLFEDQKLEIIARVEAENLDLEKAISTSDENDEETGDRELSLPRNIKADIELSLHKLSYASFTATSVQGHVLLNRGVLHAKPISFETSKGSIVGEIKLDASKANEYPLTVHAKLNDIHITELFTQFDEFGQDFITSKHLSGIANAQVDLQTLLSHDMHINKDAIKSTIDVRISEGELVEHAPMIEIADFIRGNAIYSAFIKADELEKKLRHIRFDELTNTIRIENRKVIIPNMEVTSSAMSLSVSGVHGFNDQIDHHVNFRLAELLTKKNKDAEFGQVIDDGTGSRLFLRLYGPTNDLQVSMDKEALAEHRKSKKAGRKQEFKDILKDEFGGKGKQDKEEGQQTDGPVFNVDFEEEKDPKPASKKKGLGKLFNKNDADEDKAVTFTIDQ